MKLRTCSIQSYGPTVAVIVTACCERPLTRRSSLLEWAGILLGLVVAVALTRYSVAEVGPMDRIAVGLVNFVVALLLLGVTAGPFLVRRTRRGIRSQLD